MRDNRVFFLIAEFMLIFIITILSILIVSEKTVSRSRKVTLIIENQDEDCWKGYIYGLKKAAREEGVYLDIVNTNSIDDAEEFRELIFKAISDGSDAIITQPINDKDLGEVLKNASKKVPVVLTHSGLMYKGAKDIPCVEGDNYACGQAIAREIKRDFRNKLQDKKCGVLLGNVGTEAAANVFRGFNDEIKGSGLSVKWTLNDSSLRGTSLELLKLQSEVDFVVCLSDFSLEKATKAYEDGSLKCSLLYGIGNSESVCSGIDKGIIRSAVAQDEFAIGYRAMSKVIDRLKGKKDSVKSENISYNIVRRDNLYSEDNESMFYYFMQ